MVGPPSSRTVPDRPASTTGVLFDGAGRGFHQSGAVDADVGGGRHRAPDEGPGHTAMRPGYPAKRPKFAERLAYARPGVTVHISEMFRLVRGTRHIP